VSSDDSSGLDNARAFRCLADHRVLQGVRESANASLHLGLLFFRGVIAAVFFQIALFAGNLNSLGNFLATLCSELLQLERKPVIGLLREPHL